MKSLICLIFIGLFYCNQNITTAQVSKELKMSKSELLKAGKLSELYFNSDPNAPEILKYLTSYIGKNRDPVLDLECDSDVFCNGVINGINQSNTDKIRFTRIEVASKNSSGRPRYLPDLVIILEDETK